MNRSYRSQWSEALNTWIAVPEISKNKKQHTKIGCQLFAVSLLIYSMNSWALPIGNQLIDGQAIVSIPIKMQHY